MSSPEKMIFYLIKCQMILIIHLLIKISYFNVLKKYLYLHRVCLEAKCCVFDALSANGTSLSPCRALFLALLVKISILRGSNTPFNSKLNLIKTIKIKGKKCRQ